MNHIINSANAQYAPNPAKYPHFGPRIVVEIRNVKKVNGRIANDESSKILFFCFTVISP